MMKVEISIRPLMNWIANHLAEIITLGILAVGQLAAYLKQRYDVAAHEKRLDKVEETLDDHASSPTLHRTPDFETNLTEIKAELIRTNNKLDRVLELLPRSR